MINKTSFYNIDPNRLKKDNVIWEKRLDKEIKQLYTYFLNNNKLEQLFSSTRS